MPDVRDVGPRLSYTLPDAPRRPRIASAHMQHRDPSPPPGDRARRRSLFGGRPETTPPPVTAGLSPSAAERTELVIRAYQEMIQEQLDEGLRSIQHSANALMHEIAGEVWRSTGGDKEAVGATILQELSRDQAIRALIAHSDERLQALAARTGRVEDTMNMLAESVRAAREQIARSADASMQAMSAHDGTERNVRSVDQQIAELAEQLQLLYDRTGIAMSSLHESVTFLGDRMGVEARERLEDMNRAFEARVIGLANLVRSDSEALRRELVSTAEAHDETIAQLMEERLTRVTE